MMLRSWMKARGLSELGVFLQVTCLVIKLEPKSAIPTGLTPQIYTEGTDCRKTASAAKFSASISRSHENPINPNSPGTKHTWLCGLREEVIPFWLFCRHPACLS